MDPGRADDFWTGSLAALFGVRVCPPEEQIWAAGAINSVFWANNLDPPKTHNSNMIMNDFICLSFNSLLSL